jgi:hypothetical protein
LAHFLAIPLLATPALPVGIDHAVTCATAAFIFSTHFKLPTVRIYFLND